MAHEHLFPCGGGYPSWTLFRAVEAQIKFVQQWIPRDLQLTSRI